MANYNDTIKAAAMAALLEGQAVSKVAADYPKIPIGTIKSWKQRAKKGQVAGVAPEKRNEIGELLLEFVNENLTTLKAQAIYFRDPEWLSRQNASEMGVLYGIMCDKTIRLLESMTDKTELAGPNAGE